MNPLVPRSAVTIHWVLRTFVLGWCCFSHSNRFCCNHPKVFLVQKNLP